MRTAASALPELRNLSRSVLLFSTAKEPPMADSKTPENKPPGEHAEGKYHYNPGNQAGKTAEDSKKDDTLDRVKNRAPPPPHERT
jgi:hypothetical protein